MAREVRTRVVDDAQAGVYHCINRCVRGAYLFGHSPFSGRECDYRPQIQNGWNIWRGTLASMC